MDSNSRLYNERKEPECLAIRKGLDYINVRTCDDKSVLERVLAELDAFGDDAVLIPWLSPPFYVIRGYGLYSISEADRISVIEREERWVSYRLGGRFDKSYFLRRLK